MPAQDPITITAAIIARLSTVKVANGYANDVHSIFEVPLAVDQLPEGALPALVVLEDPEGESFTWDDAAVYRARLPYVVAGMINEPGADIMAPDRARRIRSLEKDVRKALLQDPWFGQTCKDSILQKTTRYVDTDRGFAFFETDMYVIYHFHKGSL